MSSTRSTPGEWSKDDDEDGYASKSSSIGKNQPNCNVIEIIYWPKNSYYDHQRNNIGYVIGWKTIEMKPLSNHTTRVETYVVAGIVYHDDDDDEEAFLNSTCTNDGNHQPPKTTDLITPDIIQKRYHDIQSKIEHMQQRRMSIDGTGSVGSNHSSCCSNHDGGTYFGCSNCIQHYCCQNVSIIAMFYHDNNDCDTDPSTTQDRSTTITEYTIYNQSREVLPWITLKSSMKRLLPSVRNQQQQSLLFYPTMIRSATTAAVTSPTITVVAQQIILYQQNNLELWQHQSSQRKNVPQRQYSYHPWHGIHHIATVTEVVWNQYSTPSYIGNRNYQSNTAVVGGGGAGGCCNSSISVLDITLLQLTHAHFVLWNVHQMMHHDAATVNENNANCKDDAPPTKLQRPADTPCVTHKNQSTSSSNLEQHVPLHCRLRRFYTQWKKYTHTFCINQSLLVRHCWYGYSWCRSPPTPRRGRGPHGMVPIWKVWCNIWTARTNDTIIHPHPDECYHVVSQYDYVMDRMICHHESVIIYIDAFLGVVWSMVLLYGYYYFYYYYASTTTSCWKNTVVATQSCTTESISNTTASSTIVATWIGQHYAHLNGYIQWLEHFPLGFKLNQSLLYNVGREVQRVWNVHEGIVLYIVESVTQYTSMYPPLQWIPIVLAATISFVFGGSGCIAFLLDILRLSTIHMSIFAGITVHIYSYELYLLSTLWKLFCGKKRNIIRHRTDTMEYDAMQLLLGTILFAIVLFLCTTIVVGHIFYTLLYLIPIGVMLPLALLYTTIHHFPWGILWLRRKHPGWFMSEIYIMDDFGLDFSDSTIPIDVTQLGFRSHTYGNILSSTIRPRIQPILLWLYKLILRSMTGSTSSWSDFLDTIIPLPEQNELNRF
jgi:N-acetylglucosaminyl transferase component (Gpi1)